MFNKKLGNPVKGGTTLNAIVGTLLFSVAIITTIVTLKTYYADYAGYVKIPIENLQVVKASHAFEICLARLSANEQFISKNMLEEYAGDSVNRICEIQEPVMWGYVKDVEEGDEYLFPPPDKNLVEKLFPPAMVNDFIEKIRRWTKKSIKTEHMIWVSIAVPEVRGITDENEELNGEFLIQAKWEGLGSLKANDMVLRLYNKSYYKRLPVNVNTISPYEVKQWLEDMEKNGIKFDSRVVNFQNTPVKSIMPFDYELEKCDKIGGLLHYTDSETCIEVYENINKIHMGRLGVKI